MIVALRRHLVALALAIAFAPLAIVGCIGPQAYPDAEVRTIDELLTLIKAGLDIAAKSAQEPWLAGSARDEPMKDDELVDAAVNRAVGYTLPPEVVREFFSAQVAAAAHVQSVLYSQWQAQPELRPRSDLRPSRETPVRIESANTPLLAALSKAYPLLRRPGGKDLLMQRADKVLAEIPGGVSTSVLALRPLLSVAH